MLEELDQKKQADPGHLGDKQVSYCTKQYIFIESFQLNISKRILGAA